jgi:hypothetical protein
VHHYKVRVARLSSRVLLTSPVASWLLLNVETVPASQHGFNSPVAFCKTNSSRTSFVDDVEGCFRGSPETTEAGCGHHLANTLFAGLRAQAQRNFL